MIEPHLHRNRSGREDIHIHLTACAATFTPPLWERVNLADYAAKLAVHAERFEAWAGPTLIGLVAVYCNEPGRRNAFVTNVSVLPERTRAGIGQRLLDAAINHVRDIGFTRITLSVDHRAAALGLYRGLGFAEDTREERTLLLALDLTAPRSCAGDGATSQEGGDREAQLRARRADLASTCCTSTC
ncbi:GNAT family N-acetyltransferase [Methylorubrum thiocyanatum]|uniref:GNAT family N-acetyltransferase n=1 Tax=Methylorubrum thiocyanatum TaxID=47958 RepID=UPI0035C84132